MITLAPATATDVDDFVALATEMDVFYGDVRPDPPRQRAEEISAVLFGDPPAAFALLARDDAGKLVGFASYSFRCSSCCSGTTKGWNGSRSWTCSTPSVFLDNRVAI